MDSKKTTRISGHKRKCNNQSFKFGTSTPNGAIYSEKDNQKDRIGRNRANKVYRRSQQGTAKKPKGNCSCSGGCKRECTGYSKGGRI